MNSSEWKGRNVGKVKTQLICGYWTRSMTLSSTNHSPLVGGVTSMGPHAASPLLLAVRYGKWYLTLCCDIWA